MNGRMLNMLVRIGDFISVIEKEESDRFKLGLRDFQALEGTNGNLFAVYTRSFVNNEGLDENKYQHFFRCVIKEFTPFFKRNLGTKTNVKYIKIKRE